jgi:cell division septal protein FtsQ
VSRAGSRSRRRGRKKFLNRLGALAGLTLLLGGIGVLARATLNGVTGSSTFTVEEMRVEGTRYLDPADLLVLAEPERFTSTEVGAHELESLGERVSAHPLVERVAVRRSLPASVIIEIEELVPVAFLEGSPVKGVDASGRVLEGLEPPRYGALPFVTGIPAEGGGRGEGILRAVAALDALTELTPRLYDRVSEVQPRPEGEIALLLSEGAVVVRIEETRLTDVLPLVGALVNEGEKRHGPLLEVDLRFADTVIYRELKGGE